MNEFLIELQAKLDEAKLKSDISRLQDIVNELKLKAEIDPKTISDLNRQIENLFKNKKINISNIKMNQGNAAREGEKIGQQINQGISKELSKSSSLLNNFKKSLIKIGMDSGSIDKISERIKTLDVQIESLNQSVSHFGYSLNEIAERLEEMRKKII